ncbi:diaminohydroxyphosphoribosylaminopyrimidine deaminase/5-amino-6-(5-phosphoribosylamino)uracil reductase [Saonia flava]|uniref:Riboflavin biosynthesis protein RibD n=1 Tax=Saonia flava TaxID=523696 RepID=A0A846R102_9FLAO|nr:bifunctional diaminohydroxyphosphoribosylaminopyrimidine deaminase/5-amino-6-(5-phosphoribosylamino)uracil reductase RibD [Saonia flava]NJB70539.1 diaminohydroxyphosphoribosylaminopyrimidine deaminase/5-amino-6-(5-phosphoribosylamino)uracil reductase [Saonia flava]
MQTTDEKYISRCIQLGKNGLGNTAPNPMVGSVIVYNNKIIGEGYTSPYGGNHAEVNAINSVASKELLKESTLYVTLEPCSHHGKTPPCADLIVKNKIPRVVIGITDPHKKVAGKGIERLKGSGCKVTIGVLEKECREHHKRFLTFQKKKRPYIILKWAETSDGYIAPKQDKRKNKPEPYWITNKHSRQLVHKWRSEEQSILVGTTTVLEDNPKLNIRSWTGKNPIRVVLDRNLKINGKYHVLDKSTKTIFITSKEKTSSDNLIYETINFIDKVPQQICDILSKHQFTSILIEGGAKTIQAFIESDLWDEARVFVGDVSFDSGIKAPSVVKKQVKSIAILEDTLNIYSND